MNSFVVAARRFFHDDKVILVAIRCAGSHQTSELPGYVVIVTVGEQLLGHFKATTQMRIGRVDR